MRWGVVDLHHDVDVSKCWGNHITRTNFQPEGICCGWKYMSPAWLIRLMPRSGRSKVSWRHVATRNQGRAKADPAFTHLEYFVNLFTEIARNKFLVILQSQQLVWKEDATMPRIKIPRISPAIARYIPRRLLNPTSNPSFLSAGKVANLQRQENLIERRKQASLAVDEEDDLVDRPRSPEFAPFLVGRKQVFLPNFIITLKRNERLEPWHAVFDVPLHLSKLDLRDYLWHLYRVQSVSIRSTVIMGELGRIYHKGRQRFGPWRRSSAKKKMVVQLAKPFRFPRVLTEEELAAEYAVFLVVWANFVVTRKIDMIRARRFVARGIRWGNMAWAGIPIRNMIPYASGCRFAVYSDFHGIQQRFSCHCQFGNVYGGGRILLMFCNLFVCSSHLYFPFAPAPVCFRFDSSIIFYTRIKCNTPV